MKLVGPLVAGIAGCESGHAEIYTRGSASRSGYYTNAEGTGSPATTDVALDANGRAVVYVDEYADVQVYDSDGLLSIEFTVMDTDRTTEVISQSFTGQAYAGGGSAASLPVSLNAVLDAWLDNAGAVDWKVDIDGTAVDIGDAVGRGYGALFSVKAYGATGDGATDDRAAILAAKAAAAAVGGTVFFPAGTYRCASTVTWKDTNMLGAPGKVLITESNWTFESANSDLFVVAGLSFYRIRVSVAQTSGPVEIVFRNCEMEQSLSGPTNAFFIGTDATSRVNVYCEACRFFVGSNQATHTIDCQLRQGHLHLVRCVVVGQTTPSNNQDLIRTSRMKVAGLLFDMTGYSAVNAIGDLIEVVKYISAETDVEVSGVVVTSTPSTFGGKVYRLNFTVSSDTRFVDHGTYVDPSASVDLYGYTSPALAAVTGSEIAVDSRRGRVFYETGTIAGTDSLEEQLEYEHIWYNKTDTGALTIDLDANPPPPGSRTVIVVVNASGGTPSLDVIGEDVGNNSSHSMTVGRKTIYYVDYFGSDGILVNAIQDIA